jgi:hypothetical protein
MLEPSVNGEGSRPEHAKAGKEKTESQRAR